ncbi:MAG: polysaccharide deacetylase family protein [Gammaproteobacteria bacterium]
MTRLLLCLLLWVPLAAAQSAVQRTMAITFDDLPYASVPSEDDAALAKMTARLLHPLRAAAIPAVGFVNESRLYREGSLVPARVDLLQAWLDAGHELGNHTYSHVSLNRVPLDAFTANLLQGETVTRPLAQAAGRPLRWFRPPYLHLGQTAAVRAQFDAFLAARGYRVAPVTVNHSEWVFAVAYSRAQTQGNAEAAQRIAEAYLPYMEAELARAEQLALDRFGRPIPHVLLLHANALNADHVGALAARLQQRGYRFVTLDAALQDSAYATPLGTTLIEGESWLEHWARAAGLRPEQPPAVPGFVRQWAGPAAYRGY